MIVLHVLCAGVFGCVQTDHYSHTAVICCEPFFEVPLRRTPILGRVDRTHLPHAVDIRCDAC